MTAKNKPADELGLGDDPLSDVVVEHLYKPSLADASTQAKRSPKSPRARVKGRQPLRDGQTYRLVTFSFYEDDVARLDALLAEAKKRGHRKVSRSQIVRLALRNVDLDGLPEVI